MVMIILSSWNYLVRYVHMSERNASLRIIHDSYASRWCCETLGQMLLCWADLTGDCWRLLLEIPYSSSLRCRLNTCQWSRYTVFPKSFKMVPSCFFVCNMWVGHIILILNKLLWVNSSQRIDASPMLCQTCAFYLVTRQLCCLISIAEPGGNALLRWGHWREVTAMFWLLKHIFSLCFINISTYLDQIFSSCQTHCVFSIYSQSFT